jgi:hypothetical protein
MIKEKNVKNVVHPVGVSFVLIAGLNNNAATTVKTITLVNIVVNVKLWWTTVCMCVCTHRVTQKQVTLYAQNILRMGFLYVKPADAILKQIA